MPRWPQASPIPHSSPLGFLCTPQVTSSQPEALPSHIQGPDRTQQAQAHTVGRSSRGWPSCTATSPIRREPGVWPDSTLRDPRPSRAHLLGQQDRARPLQDPSQQLQGTIPLMPQGKTGKARREAEGVTWGQAHAQQYKTAVTSPGTRDRARRGPQYLQY